MDRCGSMPSDVIRCGNQSYPSAHGAYRLCNHARLPYDVLLVLLNKPVLNVFLSYGANVWSGLKPGPACWP